MWVVKILIWVNSLRIWSSGELPLFHNRTFLDRLNSYKLPKEEDFTVEFIELSSETFTG
jgi:hypothetical protein